MKKFLPLVFILSVLTTMPMTASAHRWQDDPSYDHDSHWRHIYHHDYNAEVGMPFRWHNSYHFIREHYHLERIYGREWEHRFHGLHPYRWTGREGFWHHGHYIKDAVLFFDENNELVSVGYMSDGVFIMFREDHEVYENHDSFFISWWRR